MPNCIPDTWKMWLCRLIILALVLIALIHATLGIVTKGSREDIEWTHHISLPANLELKWTNTDPEWITMEMSSPARGYIGIGFSPSGGMAG